MTADAWAVYDVFLEQLGNELHDFDVDTIKVALFTSTYSPDTANDVSLSALSGELAGGNGYTAGGQALTTVTWNAATGTLTFDSDNPAWTASGGDLIFRYAVIYNSSAGGTNDLICYSLLDNTPDDITVTDGNTFTLEMNASGIFTIS